MNGHQGMGGGDHHHRAPTASTADATTTSRAKTSSTWPVQAVLGVA